MNKKFTMEFVVVTNEKREVVEIGRTIIGTPRAKCDGDRVKWFDDTKLLRKEKISA